MKLNAFVRLFLLALVALVLSAPPALAQQIVVTATAAPRFNAHLTPEARPNGQRALADWLAAHPLYIEAEPTTSRAALQNTAAWTVLIFGAADNDLEEFGLEDLNELEMVGSTAEVNFVAQFDRAEGFTDADGDWTDTRRYFVTQDDDLSTINSELLESLGETNSGDPATLVDFATWGMANFAAEKYMLILWDHGGAWTSFGIDEDNGGDSLNLPELDSALAEITATAGITFEVIGFDACLMAQLEVLDILAPYASYAIVAEETIPGNGWFYTAWGEQIVNNPAMNGAELGPVIVDSYMQFYTEIVTWYEQFDLNVFDLSQIGGVHDAVTEFARAMQADPAAQIGAVGTARSNTQIFGGANSPDDADYYSSADLLNFLELFGQLSDDSGMQQAASSLAAAVQNFIIYTQASPGLPGARGMAVYFPQNLELYEAYGSEYPDQVSANMAGWQAFLGTFYGVAVEALPPSAAARVNIAGVYPPGISSIHQPPVIVFETDGQDIVEVSFSATLQLADGGQIMLDLSPLESSFVTADGEAITGFDDGFSVNEFTWGVEMPVISDGTVEIDTLLLSNRSNPDVVTIAGTYISQDGRETPANVVFDLETAQATSVWGRTEATEGAALAEIRPAAGDQFLPAWRYLDEANDFILSPANSVPLTFGEAPFSFRFAPADSGDYVLTIRVEDVAGNVSADSIAISVNNARLDTAYRGFTDIDFGLNFLYPWEWTAPTVQEMEDGGVQLIVSDPLGELNIYVMAYDAASLDEMIETGYAYLETFQGEVTQAERPLEGVDYEASVLDYQFTLDDGLHIGALLMAYVPELATGYIIDLDATEARAEEGLTAFNAMAESLNFFEPPQIGEGATAEEEMPAPPTVEQPSGDQCAASVESNVNLREGPGTAYGIVGSLPAGQSAAVIGAAVGDDGFVWFQLGEGVWVRSDVVLTSGPCDTIPVVEPETSAAQPSTDSVQALFDEWGLTEDDIAFFLGTFDPPITLEELQAWVDDGEITLDDVNAWLESDFGAATGGAEDTQAAIIAIFAEYGIAEADIDSALSEIELTLDDLVALVDSGEVTLDDIRAMFEE